MQRRSLCDQHTPPPYVFVMIVQSVEGCSMHFTSELLLGCESPLLCLNLRSRLLFGGVRLAL